MPCNDKKFIKHIKLSAGCCNSKDWGRLGYNINTKEELFTKDVTPLNLDSRNTFVRAEL